MPHVTDEIATQPECWSRAVAMAETVSAVLPAAGERAAIVGCGTSYHIARACAALREGAGHGETDAFPASELPARRYDRVVFLSRSGTTTEVLEALRGLPAGTPSTAVTADPTTPIASAADETVTLDFADELSIVQTRFATTALMLFRAYLGEDTATPLGQVGAAVSDPLPEGATECRQFTFLGHGWTVGLAEEAALKLRESAGAWTEAYPAMEYRHGPISVSGPSSLVWIFGRVDRNLFADARRTGALVVCSDGDPLADLVRAQRLAVELATSRGRDPDRPRNLTRSVILAPGDAQRLQ